MKSKNAINIGVMLLMIFGLFNKSFAGDVALSNKNLVRKYSKLNVSLAKSIKQANYSDLVAETKRIAPLLSQVIKSTNSFLSVRGVTTLQLQTHLVSELEKYDLAPSMAGYQGFPAAMAISIDDELIHNLPSNKVIKDGDVVTVELGASSSKAYASQVWSFVAAHDPAKSKLLITAKLALSNAINTVNANSTVGDIGHAISSTLNSSGYSVIREYCGYTMGNERIMSPQILGYGKPGGGDKLQVGQIINIQVLASTGDRNIKLAKDGWGIRAKDGLPSVAVGAMVLVTEKGYEVLSDIDI